MVLCLLTPATPSAIQARFMSGCLSGNIRRHPCTILKYPCGVRDHRAVKFAAELFFGMFKNHARLDREVIKIGVASQFPVKKKTNRNIRMPFS